MTETLKDRAARYLSQHVIPRERPRPPRPCWCGQTPTRLFMNGPLCADHAPPLPRKLAPVTTSPGLPPRTYGTATTDPRPGR